MPSDFLDHGGQQLGGVIAGELVGGEAVPEVAVVVGEVGGDVVGGERAPHPERFMEDRVPSQVVDGGAVEVGREAVGDGVYGVADGAALRRQGPGGDVGGEGDDVDRNRVEGGGGGVHAPRPFDVSAGEGLCDLGIQLDLDLTRITACMYT